MLLYAGIVLLIVGPLAVELDRVVLRVAWLAIALIATLLAGVARGRLAAGSWTEGRALASALLAWAAAEGQAMVGLTAYLLSGDRPLAVLALALFAYLYLRYPPGSFRNPARE